MVVVIVAKISPNVVSASVVAPSGAVMRWMSSHLGLVDIEFFSDFNWAPRK